MNVRRAFTYLFRDPHWVRKLGIAMLVNLVPTALLVFGLLSTRDVASAVMGSADPSTLWSTLPSLAMIPLNGFVLRITRNVVAGVDVPLPEWADLGDILRDGFKLWGVIMVWSLPERLVAYASGSFSGNSGGEGIPVLDALAGVISLTVLVVQPAAEARLAVTGAFRAGLDVAAAFETVRRNLGGYLLLLLVTGGVVLIGFALSAALVALAWWTIGLQSDSGSVRVAGITSLGLTLAVFGPYLAFVVAHLSGQAFAWANPAPVRPAGGRESGGDGATSDRVMANGRKAGRRRSARRRQG
jgi:Protein of unknown function (DUF4013)